MIGYSDSAPFSVNVGPTAVSENTKGVYADAVKHVLRDSTGTSSAAPESASGEHSGSSAVRSTSSAAQQAEFKTFLASRTRKSVYDELPPLEKE